MRFVCRMGWVVWVCAAAIATGAERTATPPPAGNRYLFVVDTSSSMKKLAAPTRQAVFEMIFTGLYEQLKAGDTYGLWTFSDQPRTGIYPMQTWQPDRTMELASHAAKFLRDQDHGSRARMEPLMEKAEAIIQAVKDVTILVLSDDETPVAGTPFDAGLAAAYELHADEFRDADQPFITVLTAAGGELVSASVHIAGSPILLLTPADSATNTAPIAANPAAPIHSPPSVTATSRSPAVATAPVDTAGAAPRRRTRPNIIMTGSSRPTAPAPVSPAQRPAAPPNDPPGPGSDPAQKAPSGPQSAVAAGEETLAPPTALPPPSVPPGHGSGPFDKHEGLPRVAAREGTAAPTPENAPVVAAQIPSAVPVLRPRTLLWLGAVLFGAAGIFVAATLRRLRQRRREASFITRSFGQMR